MTTVYFICFSAKQVITFTQELHNVHTKENSTMAAFECELSEPFFKVEWFKNGVSISTSEKYRTHSDRRIHFLSVLGIEMSDAAEYTCALVEDNSIQSTAKLIVEAPDPPCFVSELEPCAVRAGEPARFCGMITGTPKLEISWYKDDKKLSEIKISRFFKMVQFEDTYQLEIAEAYPEDEGLYTCVASNSAGKVSCSATLSLGVQCVIFFKKNVLITLKLKDKCFLLSLQVHLK
uniref:Ig-like domain-containing protein n=1 Tax=Callorhinchus milii TaxID=7868 RepID=A0A4W3IYW1_CALMI